MEDYLNKKKQIIEENLRMFFNELKSDENIKKLETIGVIDADSFRKSLCEPLEEAVLYSGKRIRPILVYLAHDLVGGSFEQIDKLAILPELVHKGSVVIDDIQDKSQKRDNKKPLYKLYGVPTAINTGNFLYFIGGLSLDKVKIDKEKKLEVLTDYLYEGLIAHIGQGSDIYWRETKRLPTEKEYLQMNAYKVSTFRFAAKLGATLGGANKEQKNALLEVIEAAGTAYQIRDDLLSLDERVHDYGDDITEGKITLMILKTLQNNNTDSRKLREILSMKTRDSTLIKEAIDIMKKNRAIDYAQQIAKGLLSGATRKLHENFPESRARQVLSELIAYGISREK